VSERRIDTLGRIVPDGFEPWPPEGSAYAQSYAEAVGAAESTPIADLVRLLDLAFEHVPDDCPHYDEIAAALARPAPGGLS
jgi:hypothetical protein